MFLFVPDIRRKNMQKKGNNVSIWAYVFERMLKSKSHSSNHVGNRMSGAKVDKWLVKYHDKICKFLNYSKSIIVVVNCEEAQWRVGFTSSSPLKPPHFCSYLCAATPNLTFQFNLIQFFFAAFTNMWPMLAAQVCAHGVPLSIDSSEFLSVIQSSHMKAVWRKRSIWTRSMTAGHS